MFNGWCHCVFRIQQSLNRQRTAEKERLFLVYAKQWWREFLEIRPSHQSKMVKIFAQVRLNPYVFLNLGSGLHLCTDIKEGVPKTSFICFLNHLDSCLVTSCPITSGCVSSLFAGWKRRQQASVFLCACPPGRPAAGEPSTGGPLRQPAGPREGPGGGRRGRQAGAVVLITGFPVQREGKGELDGFLAATAGMASFFYRDSALTVLQRQETIADSEFFTLMFPVKRWGFH